MHYFVWNLLDNFIFAPKFNLIFYEKHRHYSCRGHRKQIGV